MKDFETFLQRSYTSFHAVRLAEELLLSHGFLPLDNKPKENGKYFVERAGSIIAFRMGKGPLRIVAAHTDSPCFKLKSSPEMTANGYTRLNTEVYGGALRYTFLDKPLRIAGRIVRETETGVNAELYTSDFTVVIPSVALHQNREANEKFSTDPQTDLPLLGLNEVRIPLPKDTVAFDLFAVPDVLPVSCGAESELLLSPRLDDLTGAYAALQAILDEDCAGTCVAALFDNEEIGSHTLAGAGGDFLRSVLSQMEGAEDLLPRSLLLSVDNAHALHPNHPELCDPTNRPVLGGGVVIKRHAGGAYTTDALTAAAVETVFRRAGVKTQAFYNRSDLRSGSTLGAISLGQVCVPSADIGIAQLAMHAAVETVAKKDVSELFQALKAFFRTPVTINPTSATIG